MDWVETNTGKVVGGCEGGGSDENYCPTCDEEGRDPHFKWADTVASEKSEVALAEELPRAIVPSDAEVDGLYDYLEEAQREGGFGRRNSGDDEKSDSVEEREELTAPAETSLSTLGWVREHERNDVVRRIRQGLNKRSERTWSVSGGRGTSSGWLRIDAPPRRRTWDLRSTGESGPDGLPIYEEVDRGEPGHSMSPDDRAELARLLGLEDAQAHHQGVSVPAGHDYYAEFIDRAEGRVPGTHGTPYWD